MLTEACNIWDVDIRFLQFRTWPVWPWDEFAGTSSQLTDDQLIDYIWLGATYWLSPNVLFPIKAKKKKGCIKSNKNFIYLFLNDLMWDLGELVDLELNTCWGS